MFVGGVFAGNVERRRRIALVRRAHNPLITMASTGWLFLAREAYFSAQRNTAGEMVTRAHYEAPLCIIRVRKTGQMPERLILSLSAKFHTVSIMFSPAWPIVRISHVHALH